MVNIVFLFNTHILSNLQIPCSAAMDPLLKTTDPSIFEADISSSKQTFAMCFPYLSFTSHVLKQYTQNAKKSIKLIYFYVLCRFMVCCYWLEKALQIKLTFILFWEQFVMQQTHSPRTHSGSLCSHTSIPKACLSRVDLRMRKWIN